MHFLITGHTGFKGSWLTVLLRERGHTVSGISLEPEIDSLYEVANLKELLENDIRCDIRDFNQLDTNFKKVKPEVVIHLAAQALVGESYKSPIETFEVNVLGTLNVLRSSQSLGSLKAQLIVTTDKVYKNFSKSTGYVETEPLGGDDPYSASKAMADIATQSWLRSFRNPPTVIARAGNVIGGGDVCSDRLIPELIHSFTNNEFPRLRAPNSIRPWQHVLDCLNGYLMLVDQAVIGTAEGAWNFGPNEKEIKTVAEVAEIASTIWGLNRKWVLDDAYFPSESKLLLLNSEKARSKLSWSEKLTFDECIAWTVNWYKNVNSGSDPRDEMLKNIKEFETK